MYDPNAFNIYTDGSALKNPGGPGGIAAVMEFPMDLNQDNEVIFRVGYYKTTNQRMELLAIIKALEYIHENAESLNTSYAALYTDSKYVAENQNSAVFWRGSGWRSSSGTPIENVDLWKRFLTIRTKTWKTEIQKIKGKSNQITNEVDREAKIAAKNPARDDYGFQPGRVSRSQIVGGVASLYPAKNQEAVVKFYRDKPAGKEEFKVFFDLFLEEEGRYEAKYYAYIHKTNMSRQELHRKHCYKFKFNDNPEYPIIEEVEPLEDCPSQN